MNRHAASHRRAGFTLVEILIVVVILGILAAIVIPQFSNASNTARTSTMLEHLRVLRTQLGVYYVQHNETYPKVEQMWDVMTKKTDAAGNVVADGPLGPYLERAPRNQFTESSTVVAPGAGAATDGWEYNETTGELTAVGFNEKTGEYTAPGDSGNGGNP
ncbi:MAG: prepilin-type N-terminal cleavage/methylation domain-containing protein [Planctomycetes bacterium]|nr:prepilin-type N-terminal cleavage/methylation domain-containing protein [Planctomycetota bacterium]